ncbi:hypothetical protein ACXN5S_15975 [Pseudoroseicyclus sp. H15]
MPEGPAIPLLGGYRGPGDACQHVGASEETADFIFPGADLAACPLEAADTAGFVTATGAIATGQVGHWLLYSVPRGGQTTRP